MFILPYSTALTYNRPPYGTYAVTLICFVVFLLQSDPAVTNQIKYYPQSWNPVTMLTSSLAHGNWYHLIGNMIFYIAFAPAIEILLNNSWRYVWIMVFISFVVSISFSLSVVIGMSPPWPSLGFSGVVSGMIGLSAFLLPKARIKVLWWYIYGGKVFYVQAWVLAVWFIGMDTWTMLTASSYGYINVVAHVAGGFAGYLYGYFWLKELKEDTREELAHEMKAMEILRTKGKTRAQNFRDNHEYDKKTSTRNQIIEHDKFMLKIHSLVQIKKDSEAISVLMSQYDVETTEQDLEELFDRIHDWGASRTLLCLGRFIIYKLDRSKRYGRAIVYIEKCQKISVKFILHDDEKAKFYINTAQEMNKDEVANNLALAYKNSHTMKQTYS